MKCPICDLDFRSYTAVSLHFRNKHGTSLEFKEIMRLKLIEEKHEGVTPTCKCGCGEIPKYYDYERGYVEFVRGHAARVNNNWGHNEVAQKKSQDVRREMHKRGEIPIWNKGRTKETDERVAAYGKSGSHTLKTDPACPQQRAEHMSSQWKKGEIVPLRGPTHSQWKGGASALQPIVRARLHAKWTYPKLRASGFKCSMCSALGPGLEVHHNSERFASILQKAIATHGEIDTTRPDDDFEKKDLIANWVVDYHLDNDVSGIVLCEQCHEFEHQKC